MDDEKRKTCPKCRMDITISGPRYHSCAMKDGGTRPLTAKMFREALRALRASDGDYGPVV